MKGKELRMYFFVMYNLSGIQKGIQAGHAALEYAKLFGHTEQYKEFITYHKTFILLDGGGSGDMCNRYEEVLQMGIPLIGFHEPDLNDSLSAFAFILSEDDFAYRPDNDPEEESVYNYIRRFRLASN